MFITVKRCLALMPAPLFAVLGLYFYLWGHSHSVEMSLMWLLMALAHVLPWLQWLEQVYYRHRHRSVKQQ